jgi:hypothetical protein
LRKTAAVKSEDHTKKKQAGGANTREQHEPPGLEGFRNDPAKVALAILRLRSKEKIDPVLSNVDFAAGLKKLASDATASPKAAVALSKFVMRPEFCNAAAAAVQAAGSWTEPSNFDSEDRRLTADALERARPSWSAAWLLKATAAAGDRSPALRRYFASRLVLASGGLLGAVNALAEAQSGIKPKALLSLIRELRDCARPASGDAKPSAIVAFAENVSGASGHDGTQLKQELAQLLCAAASADCSLLLDDKFVGHVAMLDPASGARLREVAAELKNATGSSAGEPSPRVGDALDHVVIMKEAAWSDADEALGRALRDMGFMARSFEELVLTVDGEAAARAHHAKGASDIVLQWVRQAARNRGIKSLNSVGERVRFDPIYHDLDDDASPGDYVRVVTPTIVRSDGNPPIVLLRGEVELD